MFQNFVSDKKSMVIAPAGCGKTHAIAHCLKFTKGRQLILTHTHAGVASLKDKIKQLNIDREKYNVETITGFAQKYVNAFYCQNDIPEQGHKNYFPSIIKKATKLVTLAPVEQIINISYNGLFVDEYQDCTTSQHVFIMNLSKILPTHIFGDPLQGIFDFGSDSLVDFEKDLIDFKRYPDLTKPWRWVESNPELGNSLKQIRSLLENEQEIDLNLFVNCIETKIINTDKEILYEKDCRNYIWKLLKGKNFLIIHPNNAVIRIREKINKCFGSNFLLIQAIDDNSFYKLSKKLDKITPNNFYKIFLEILPRLFYPKDDIEKLFNKIEKKNKSLKGNENNIVQLVRYCNELSTNISFSLVSKIFKEIKKINRIKCYKKETLNSLCKALELADNEKITVYEAMERIRNITRKIGRNITGKCIGTTLLVKGLEFDTVVILDAHKFKCPKNFYVACTRATKRLIIFTNNNILKPYGQKYKSI